MDGPYLYTRSQYKAKPINFQDQCENNLRYQAETIIKGSFDSIIAKYSAMDDSDNESLDNYNSENDLNYSPDEYKFIKNLKPDRFNHIKELEMHIKKVNLDEIPLRFRILESNLDIKTKNYIIEKIDNFYALDIDNNEYHKLNSWIGQIEKMPFGRYTPINDKTPKEKLSFCKKCLDDAVYGHAEAKLEILNMCAKGITNPNGYGRAIGIQGPMGNGKTTLIKNGLAKALGRGFYFIGLGGASDSSFLNGHSYTWEGADSGIIVKGLQKCQVMDPVFYFDELDKVSDTPKGDEIYNILCHITDTSQNSKYQDKYLQNIDIDLSRAIFIFSFNDEEKINKILLDRLKIIRTSGFNSKNKCEIAKKYLIPSICQDIGFKAESINFTSHIIKYIIDNYTYEEKGVRSLKKIIENIVSNINLRLIMGPNDDLDELIKIKYPSLPINIDEKIVNNLVKKKDNDYISTLYM